MKQLRPKIYEDHLTEAFTQNVGTQWLGSYHNSVTVYSGQNGKHSIKYKKNDTYVLVGFIPAWDMCVRLGLCIGTPETIHFCL